MSDTGSEVKTEETPTMTVEEAARLAKIGRNQAYEAIRRGDIPHVKFGKTIRVLRAPFRRKLGLPL